MPHASGSVSVAKACHVSQSPDARQEEIGAATHSHELRQSGKTASYAVLLRQREGVGDRTAGNGRTVSKQRVTFLRESVELGTHKPGILDKLELPSDVGIEADEIQTSFCVVWLRTLERLMR